MSVSTLRVNTVTTIPASPVGYHLLAVTPHMHLLGQKMALTATLPTGRKLPLTSIPHWNFNCMYQTFFEKLLTFQAQRVTILSIPDKKCRI